MALDSHSKAHPHKKLEAGRSPSVAATGRRAQSPRLESTNGDKRALVELIAGRSAVIFYESYGHQEDNAPLKQWVARYVESGREDVSVLGVANLNGLSFGPVRRMVTATVRTVSRRHGVDLWMDFEGVFQRAPWSLSLGSHVVVVDHQSRICFAGQGALCAEQRQRFTETLEATRTLRGSRSRWMQ